MQISQNLLIPSSLQPIRLKNIGIRKFEFVAKILHLSASCKDIRIENKMFEKRWINLGWKGRVLKGNEKRNSETRSQQGFRNRSGLRDSGILGLMDIYHTIKCKKKTCAYLTFSFIETIFIVLSKMLCIIAVSLEPFYEIVKSSLYSTLCRGALSLSRKFSFRNYGYNKVWILKSSSNFLISISL